MPFVQRDAGGEIIALTITQDNASQERLPANHPEVLAFLRSSDDANDVKNYLHVTDLELARVVEDLIDLLIEKNLILLTDLPEAARDKLLKRRFARDTLQGSVGLVVDKDDIL